MVNRSIAFLFRLGAAAALVVLGTTAFLQVGSAVPTSANPVNHSLYGWGNNTFGDLGVGSPDNNTGPDTCGPFQPCSWTPVQMSLPAGVTGTAIAAGQDMSFAIGSDGNLYASGENGVGQLGDGTKTGPDVCTQPLGLPDEPCSTVPVRVSLPSGITPTAVASGYESGYAIGSDSHLYAWGANSDGELGDGTTTNADTPVQVSLPSGVTATAIASGNSTAYAIGSDGKLYAWGAGSNGELGDGTTSSSDTPVQVSLPTGATARAIAGGYYSGYAVGSDGKLYSWGDNTYGELGDGTTTGSETPLQVSLPMGVTATAVAGGSYSGYAIDSDGKLYAWGYNGDGELGNASTTGPDICDNVLPCSTAPVQVSLPIGVTARAIAGGLEDGYAIGSDGNVYAWGQNYFGELGDGSNSGADCADGIGTCSATPGLVLLPSGTTPLTLGSTTSSQSAFAIVATEPLPTTQVLIPRTGAHLFGWTFLDASSKHASSVEFRLFGGSYGYAAPVICTAKATIFGWLCLWNTSTVPKGSYVLVSEAFNSAGSTFSSGVGVSVDY
jgi:alpha-tubulin suppressor-like RCC1 family protein